MTDWNTLYDKIIVRRHESDKMVRGVDVAPAHETLKNRGIVMSIGNGRIAPGALMPLTIQVGQEVLFHEHSGVNLDPDDDSLIILREDEVLAYRDAPPAVSVD